MGAGIYANAAEAFASLDKLEVIEPDAVHRAEYQAAYAAWKETLKKSL
jgi:xylulokinase